MIMTNHELDLQTSCRIPESDIRVGDYVKVKSKEWYDKWKDCHGYIKTFVPNMVKFCGKVFLVKEIFSDGRFSLDGADFWYWEPRFIEEVYPKVECSVFNTSERYSTYPSITNVVSDFSEFSVTLPFGGAANFCANAISVPPKPLKQKQKLKLINKFKPIKLKKV